MKMSKGLIVACAGFALLFSGLTAHGQATAEGEKRASVTEKLIFIGPDGKKQEIELGKGANGDRQVQILRWFQEKNEGEKGASAGKRRIVLVGPDGKTRELNPGQFMPLVTLPCPSTTGKMVFIGPDGKKHEIDLRQLGTGPCGIVRLGAIRGRVASPFMVGVDCEPVSPALRSQLKLKDNVGLVIKGVVEGTAASKAGLRQYDVLVQAGKKDLSEVKDLVQAVEEAGKGNEALTLSMFREGKKMKVEVTPAKRNPVQVQLENLELHKQLGHLRLYGNVPVQWQGVGPGVIVPTKNPELEKQLNDLKARIKKLEEAIEKLKSSRD
jgi:hypothetical protein